MLALLFIFTSMNAQNYIMNPTPNDVSDCKFKADKGDATAQFQLALFYILPNNVLEQNIELANKWLLKSASQGYGPAEAGIADFYKDGISGETDYEKAYEWYLKAAQHKHSETAVSQFNVGYCLENGIGVKKDLEKACYWYEQAIFSGHKYALGNIMDLYTRNDMYSQAEQLVNKLQNTGNAEDLFNIAIYYEKTNDLQKYKSCLQKSASKGYAPAEVQIGFEYAEGKTFPKDNKKAFDYYTSAANKGYFVAEYNLAWVYLSGDLGVKKNKELGLKFANKVIKHTEKEPGLIGTPDKLLEFQDKAYGLIRNADYFYTRKVIR